MKTTREDRMVAEVASTLSDLVLTAVAETIAQRSAEPGRTHLEGMFGGQVADDTDRATELMGTLILVRWLSVVREQVPDRDRAADVLGWIRENLGSRYAARARYTVGALVSEAESPGVMQGRNALRDDFLPSFVWQLAGAVAVYGEGDVGWLRRLVGG